jgi:hypothetical protein
MLLVRGFSTKMIDRPSVDERDQNPPQIVPIVESGILPTTRSDAELLKRDENHIFFIAFAFGTVSQPVGGQGRKAIQVPLPQLLSSVGVAGLQLVDPGCN